MYKVVFDIETYGNEETLGYKDFKYIKYRNKYEEDEDVIDNLSLEPFLSYIVSIAYLKVTDDGISEAEVIFLTDGSTKHEDTRTITYMGDGYTVRLKPIQFNGRIHNALLEAERKLISEFLNVLAGASLLISFNGKRFDAHFLKIRSMLHGLPNIDILHNSKKQSENHVDLMEFISSRGFKGYSFDFIATQFGLESPKSKYSGKDVKNLFKDGRYEDIAEYNAYDVIALYNLYTRLKEYVASHGSVREEPSDKQIQYLCSLIDKISYSIQKGGINLSELNLKDILDKSEVRGAISTLVSIKESIEKQERTSQNTTDQVLEISEDDDDIPF